MTTYFVPAVQRDAERDSWVDEFAREFGPLSRDAAIVLEHYFDAYADWVIAHLVRGSRHD
jgi:hypothetical protein